jgi:hypothetical protein
MVENIDIRGRGKPPKVRGKVNGGRGRSRHILKPLKPDGKQF